MSTTTSTPISELTTCDLESLLSSLPHLNDAELRTIAETLEVPLPTRATEVFPPHPRQAEFLGVQADEVLFGGAAGGGKALSLDTLLPTPTGWTTMGEVAVGDTLFDEHGHQCRVLAATPVMTGRPCYRVRFDDGTEIVADAEHQWLTFDYDERTKLARRSDEFRSRRRATRPERGSGAKPWLAERNRTMTPATLPPPVGTVRTTAEIAETLVVRGGRRNHSVPLAGILETDERIFSLDPYILGVWLGDGHSNGGAVTTPDAEVVRALDDAGFEPRKGSQPYYWGTRHLTTKLRALGVLNNKHVPDEYLRGSADQRLALLQGLMDTDGSADLDGRVEFSTTTENLAFAVYELAASLGDKPTIQEGRAKLYGKDCGPKWRVCWTPHRPVFRLARKLNRQRLEQRLTTRSRYIVAADRIDSVPVRCIAVDSPSRLFLASRAMIPTHNSLGLLLWLAEGIDIPSYSGIMFRRTTKQLDGPGGLLEKSWPLYRPLGGRYMAGARTWAFPSGAKIKFDHLNEETDKLNHQGKEYHRIAFDELTHFTETQYTYLTSRKRQLVGFPIRLGIRATANPGGPGHDWVKKRFVPDEAIAAIRELDPRAPTPAGLVFRSERSLEGFASKSLAFVPSRIADNPSLDMEDYLTTLADRSPVERAQLMAGDWGVVEGSLIDGGWFRYWRPSGDYYFVADPSTGKCLMTIDPRECQRFVTIDTAGSSKDVGREKRGKAKSFSVASVWDFHRRDGWLVLRDRWRERCDINQLCAAVDRIDQEHHPEWLGVEDATLGPSLAHLMSRLPFQLLSHEGKDKLTRFSTAMNLLQQGKVFFPTMAPWLPTWESELLAWTGHEDDPFDQGDTLGYAAKYARRNMTGAVVVPERGAFVMGRR